MTFRDLNEENPQHLHEFSYVAQWYPLRTEQRTEEERRKFSQKWLSGKAALGEWEKANPGETAAAERRLNGDLAAGLLKRRMQLYDWWLEYRVQGRLMRRLMEVKRYAPHQVQAYAQFEDKELDRFLAGQMTAFEQLMYRTEKTLDRRQNYGRLLASMQKGYVKTYDIHDPRHFQYVEALVRYKTYLQRIAAEGLQEEVSEVATNELPHVQLWRDLLKLSENLTVQYQTIQNARNGRPFTDYRITGISGCQHSWTLKEKLLAVFETGFDALLLRLPAMSYQTQRTVLESLKNGVEGLLGAIGDGIHTWEREKQDPVEEVRYRRFTRLSYRGDDDLRLVFDHKARDFMDFRLLFYAEEWLDGIHVIIRKIEHALNNLNLIAVYAEKAVYDVANILNNTFVLESAEGASQGTAFYLRHVGIITCDHCVRRIGTDPFYSDLVIYRADNLNTRAKVRVVRSHPHLDIAVLKLETEKDDFLAEGLEKGDSDTVRQMDFILAAGFPNYNYGDSGVTTEGKVIGIRTIGGIQHLLVSNPLVTGNSGGPVLNREGKVIGVVVTGSDSLRSAPSTEKHGLVPINVLEWLLAQDTV